MEYGIERNIYSMVYSHTILLHKCTSFAHLDEFVVKKSSGRLGSRTQQSALSESEVVEKRIFS